MKYTPAQQYAVYGDCGNLLVSAAAGSGKTTTLSAHIVELVRSGKASVDEMLVVTFNRTAAADMKRKIQKNLTEAAKAAKGVSPEEYARLSSSALKVQSADISTMDSLFYKILRRRFSDVGLPADSHLIANEAILDKMKQSVMRDTVGAMFDSGDEEFLLLADALATVRETEKLDEELYRISRLLTARGLEADALSRYADRLECEVSSGEKILFSPYGKPLADALRLAFRHYLTVFDYFEKEVFPFTPEVEEKYTPDLTLLKEWTATLLALLDAGELSAVLVHLSAFAPGRLPPLPPKLRTEDTAAYREFRDEMKESVKSYAMLFSRFSPDEILLSRDKTVRLLRCMGRVLKKYADTFAAKKREASLLDFEDLTAFTLALLTDKEGNPTPTALEVGKKYRYVFIDEYQDTNARQDAIFRAISQNARRFMVGDIKQAIYRFRGADPTVFSGYRDRWETVDPTHGEDFPFSPDGGRVLMMSENFRSAKPVTALTNAFSDLALPYGGIPYEDGDRLVCSRDGGDDDRFPPAEIVILEKKSRRGEKDDEDGGEDDNSLPEAEYVAERIASLLGKSNGEGIIKAADIAVIMRNKTNMTAYRDALTKRGVPSVLTKESPLVSSPAVMLILCLLNFIDNPLREVYATGALRSPVFGFTMSELISLREYAGKLPLFLGLVRCAEDEASPLSKKCRGVLTGLEEEKTVIRAMTPSQALEHLLDSFGIYSLRDVRENGRERDSIVRLLTMATEYESATSSPSSRADLSAFLDYAAEALEEGEKEKTAFKPGEADAVSILTMHASKGLEFPIVFVVECGKSFLNKQDISATVTFDSELGIGMYLPDDSGLAMCDTFFRLAVAEKIRQDAIREEMRIFYVALSRAKDRLIVTGKTQSIEKLMSRVKRFSSLDAEYFVFHRTHYLDWILEAAERQRTEYTTVTVVSLDGEEPTVLSRQSVEEKADSSAPTGDERLLLKRFDFVYPYDYLAALPSKLTVSKLAPNILDDDEADAFPTLSAISGDDTVSEEPAEPAPSLKKPDFMLGAHPATAGERGSATHVFLQFASYANLRENGADVERERLIRERYLSRETAELIHLSQIKRFADSELMDKLLRSTFVKREFRFNVRMDAADFTENESLKSAFTANGDKVTVQGVVDCVYRDPDSGRLVLVDYKTDSILPDEWKAPEKAAERLVKRHKNQLTYYRIICAEMFGEPIDEVYLYSTVLGKLIAV